MQRRPFLALAAASLLTVAAAPDPAILAAATAKRFPQPVRVGDLIGRQLLAPDESQPVLGRVAGVARGADGRLELLVRYGGVWGFGARPVAIPLDAAALLGEHVALVGITPTQAAALPTVDPASLPVLGPDEQIRMGLVKPFH